MNAIKESGDLYHPEVGRDRPWPGLAAYTKEMHDYFHGRKHEADDLCRRLRRRVLTVLFGQSGLGKTSLLQAGLFPMLRSERYVPVPVRLEYRPSQEADGQDLVAQVQAAIRWAVADAGATEWGEPRPGETLWEYFHRRHDDPEDSGEEPVRLVLVFDQFEEIFTLGKLAPAGMADVGRQPRIGAFLVEIADLIEDRVPDALKQRFERQRELIKSFTFGRQDYRVLFCFREEWLPHFEDLRELLPSIVQNRMRLTQMSGPQALEAVLLPGEALVSPQVGEQIVRFVAKAKPDEDLAALQVDPSLLSLVCQELNDRRLDRGLPQITKDLVAETSNQILQDFYERCIVDQPPGVRDFIEKELLTDTGYRDSVNREKADRNASASAIDKLVRRRLLREEERLGVRRVELTHDLLAPVVQASRDQHRLQDAALQAESREKELREQLRKSRRRLVGTVVWMGAIIAVIVGLLLFSVRESYIANRARENALAAEKKAEESDKKATAAAERADKNAERADKNAEDARLQTVAAEAALRQADAQTVQAGRERDRADKTAKALGDFTDDFLQTLNWVATLDVPVSLAVDKKDEIRTICRKTLSLAEQQARNTGDPAAQTTALRAYNLIGAIFVSFGELDEALQACDQGIAVAHRAAVAGAQRAAYWVSMLQSGRGEALVKRKKNEDALEAFRSASRWAQAAAVKDTADSAARFRLRRAVERVGDFCRDLKSFDEAAEAYQNLRRMCLRRVALDESKPMPQFVYNLLGSDYSLSYDLDYVAFAFRRIGGLEVIRGDALAAKKNQPAAEEAYRRSEAAYREGVTYAQKAARNSQTTYQQSLSYCLTGLGLALRKQNKWLEAETAYRQAIEVIEAVARREPANGDVQDDLAFGWGALGSVQIGVHKFKDAVASDARGVEIRRALLKKNDNSRTREALAGALGGLAFAEIFNRQPREAIAHSEEALRIDPSQLWIWTNFAHGLLFDNQFEEAKAIYQKYKDKATRNGLTFAEDVFDDFRQFRDAGVTHPDMAKIEELLKKPSSPRSQVFELVP